MASRDVVVEILVGISPRIREERKLWLLLQQAPNFEAVNSGSVREGIEMVSVVVWYQGWAWFAVEDAMAIMTLVCTPMGLPIAIVLENYFFVRYWLIEYTLEL